MVQPQHQPADLGYDTPQCRLIVCEQSGKWAVALRRELGETGPRVYETRSLPECWQLLAGHGASFLLLELVPAAVDDLIARLASMERESPAARAVVVAERSLAAYEMLLREAGAVHFVVTPRSLGEVAGLARRHFAATPRSRRTLMEEIRARLPWPPVRQSAVGAAEGVE
ncbi:MAG: hypothetical protein KJZ87_04995 [Thermoguttaceae bacterium]|nr:hypothetical protein [Thermoguttaceae bacterium]